MSHFRKYTMSTGRALLVYFFLVIGYLGINGNVSAQESSRRDSLLREPFRLILPVNYGWSTVNEGEHTGFELKTEGGRSSDIRYYIGKGEVPGMNLDSITGVFSWVPSNDVADRLITSVALSVLFE